LGDGLDAGDACREETLSELEERRIRAGDRWRPLLDDENDCAGEASLIGDRYERGRKCAKDCSPSPLLGRSVALRYIMGGVGAAWLGGGGGIGTCSVGCL
jgi:hypothetical protein